MSVTWEHAMSCPYPEGCTCSAAALNENERRVEALASELAAEKKAVATLEQLVPEAHAGETAAIERADAAEQRERELMGALEETAAELDEVAQLVRGGALASTVVRTATNAANRGKSLIEAHRKASK